MRAAPTLWELSSLLLQLRAGPDRCFSLPLLVLRMQIFIKGEFVGGSDILHEMHQKGELKQALEGCAQQD